MARLVLTGASGFIGRHLTQEAATIGHEVLALSRSGHGELCWSLGAPLSENVLRRSEYAIHLAHDFDDENGARRTIEGTLAVIDSLRRAGVRRQLFFSSLSARPDAMSLYGRTKLEIEQRLADAPDLVVIRPGLVLGEGGIYGRMRNWVRNFSIVPLPDGGRGKVSVIAIDDLCKKTLAILTAETTQREFNLFEPEPCSMRDLMQDEARDLGKRIIIVPIPSRLLLVMLAVAERLRIPLPVKADNLAGFLANQSAFHHPTPMEPP